MSLRDELIAVLVEELPKLHKIIFKEDVAAKASELVDTRLLPIIIKSKKEP